MYFSLPSATLFPPLQCHCHGPVALVPYANSRSILIISRKSVTTLCVWISYRGWNIGSIFKMKYSNVMMLTQWRASLSGEETASKKLSVYSRAQYGSIHAVDTLTDKENILFQYLYAPVQTNSHAKDRRRSNERGCSENTIWPERNVIIGYNLNTFGARVGALGWGTALQREGCLFDSRWCRWKFHWHDPSDRTMVLGLAQPLTEMSTRNISWGVETAGA